MAGGHYIFSLYKTSDEIPQYFVLRTVLPAFRNSSQTEEAESWEAESAGRLKLLEMIGKENNTERLELVGEYHGYPEGDIFYLESGASNIPVYYLATDFGKPWIIFGTSASEEEFVTMVENDEDLRALNSVGKPVKINARFVIQKELNFN